MIAILTDVAIGGTFLTWTVYYLSGKTNYFSVRKNEFVEVCHNPLTTVNAHKFLPNQPRNKNEFANILHKTLEHNEHLYMHQLRYDTKDAVDEVCKHAEKIIILSLRPEHVLYNCKYISRADVVPSWNTEQNLTNPDDIHEDFINYFFKESKQVWESKELKNIWDKREFLALNIDPFDHSSILDYVDPDTMCYQIDTQDAWTNLDQCINKLFSYLDIPINQKRFENWVAVYSSWKNIHTKQLNFVNNFQTIIDNIINGIEMNLDSFDLDISQEAAIQHFLIYNHNLNFKTWQLTKFTNTKQLHDLLEPNIHDLSKSLLKKRLTA